MIKIINILCIVFLFNGCFNDKPIKKEIIDSKIIGIDTKTNSSIIVDINGKNEQIFISIFCVLKKDLINKTTKLNKETFKTQQNKEYIKYSKILNKKEYCY